MRKTFALAALVAVAATPMALPGTATAQYNGGYQNGGG